MTPALLVILSTLPAPLVDALSQRAPSGTRVELTQWSAPPCHATSFEPQAIEGSGRVAVRALGKACAVWGWATVRVWSTQAVVISELKAGELVTPAVRLEEREWRRGMTPTPSLTDATAARRLAKGTALTAADVRFGPAPGTAVTVRVVFRNLTVEQRGTIASCGPRICAALPTGKRVTGTFADGVLTSALEGTP